MKTEIIRQTFLDYFKRNGHTIVPSSSLVPINDSTLLFTNAGMVQFKEAFLGLDPRSYDRAASSQRCVRAGGKHNDLENVGYTARHHTFFEMLGNFSFGDYFKRDAIRFAWDFLTTVLKLPAERLWVTVYEEDKETEDLWLKDFKVSPKRFSRCGAKDNFWSMGDTGPCGPCTEIFYDHGEEIPGGPPGSPTEDGDRYIEIWNLVFMQYNRSEDGTLTPLPKPSVDTGMGLERVAAVMQGVHSNYEIDLFKNLIAAIVKLGKIKDAHNQSLHVIADHIRSCSFLIADGVHPSNEGRGYVLRRIIRRAIRHGHRLGFQEPFFHQLVQPLVLEMGQTYPELVRHQALVEKTLYQEEYQFDRTLDQGLKILEQDIAKMTGNVIPGETVFKLYDTYGFPADLTADIARERGLTVDMAGFHQAMELQKVRAREASQFSANADVSASMVMEIKRADDRKTNFVGYHALEKTAEVVAIYEAGASVSAIKAGDKASIVLDHSPFYAESGGQVGDKGQLVFLEGVFEVENTRKIGETFLHEGELKKGSMTVGLCLTAKVDREKRRATALNHSATHLLHAVLRQVLGSHVEQKGSLVEPQRLRFDYSHFEPLSLSLIHEIEKKVNEKIRENSSVSTEVLPIDAALKRGATALFGEKYGEEVRVLQMGGGFSVELCGGTHVERTGDIGLFKIIAESGISAGIRRLEAVTGAVAIERLNVLEDRLTRVASILKTPIDTVEQRLRQVLDKNKQLEKDFQKLKSNVATGSEVNFNPREVKGIHVLAVKLPVGDIKVLREKMDQLKTKWERAVIVLGTVDDQNKIMLIAAITPNLDARLKANDLVNYVANQVGGQGGGKADVAQGGGIQPEHLDKALNSVYDWVSEQVEGIVGLSLFSARHLGGQEKPGKTNQVGSHPSQGDIPPSGGAHTG